jgi:glycosyltransferase involved in cell wall biosynthesis
MPEKERILYYCTKRTTFVQRDIKMLQELYEVKDFSFFHRSKLYTPVLFILQLFFILRHHFSAKTSFCMFAGYHSFFPALFSKIFKKAFIIILGGTDSVVIPSLGYGILGKGLIGKFARWSYYLTPHFAPVHGSLIYSENTYYDKAPKYQGIKHHVPDLKAEFTVIPNGFDYRKFRDLNLKRTENSFITVAFDLHKPHLFKLKGADMIISIAPMFPDCTFTIVGLKNLKNCPDNVTLLEAIPQDELVKLYNRHEFYFQLSITEGFPNALCEAMLCGCIPIVSNVAAMPEIIGDTGFILKEKDNSLLKKLMKDEVLNCDRKPLALKARHRIKDNYHIEQRMERFYKLVKEIS